MTILLQLGYLKDHTFVYIVNNREKTTHEVLMTVPYLLGLNVQPFLLSNHNIIYNLDWKMTFLSATQLRYRKKDGKMYIYNIISKIFIVRVSIGDSDRKYILTELYSPATISWLDQYVRLHQPYM